MPTSRLQVSSDGRRIIQEDGTPFFYLADTAWDLFHRLSREEAEHYLTVRASQNFNVIQSVVLAECNGLRTSNFYGHLPLLDEDPERPNEAYFEHIDWVMRKGTELGLRWGLLPTWGDKWTDHWGHGPLVFNTENARVYGRWIGNRYKEVPLIWIMGGDRSIRKDSEAAIVRAMCEGVREGDCGAHLMTYHPGGGAASSTWFHHDAWLDFNTIQSGHESNRMANHMVIARDYGLTPAKPTLDSEPPYEDHPDISFGRTGPAPFLDDFIARRAAWQSVFAGACGHTYGCHDIWQMYDGVREPVNRARTPWKQAIHLPGANQMRHVRSLMEQLPFLDLVPTPSIVSCLPGYGPVHALRSKDKKLALVYYPDRGGRTVNLSALEGAPFTATWYNTITGEFLPTEPVPAEPVHVFTPPQELGDSVLILRAANGIS
ncbi:MAG: DUF4038 domain-containing protein [Candidatus Methylacidiphilales bacterium]